MWVLNRDKDAIFDLSCFIGFYIEKREHEYPCLYAIMGIRKDNTSLTLAIYTTLTKAKEEFLRLCDTIS